MTERKDDTPGTLSEVEEAQGEFQELTGLDPAAHRVIEDEYDVEAGNARLKEALKKLEDDHKED